MEDRLEASARRVPMYIAYFFLLAALSSIARVGSFESKVMFVSVIVASVSLHEPKGWITRCYAFLAGLTLVSIAIVGQILEAKSVLLPLQILHLVLFILFVLLRDRASLLFDIATNANAESGAGAPTAR